MPRTWIALSVVLLLSCSGEKPEETPPTPEKPVEPAAPPAAPDKTFDAATLQAGAENITLVPSPAEMQKALSNAGLTSKLSGMLGEKKIGVEVENLDQVAVRTGVVLAEVVLTVKEAPKDVFVERMGVLKAGFAKLGAGQDIATTIDDIVTRVQNDAVNRDDLLKEVDELSGVMVPELQTEAGDWVVPLIQAGSWLQGAHLVSGAIQTEGKFDSAAPLLKQPAVVDYFLKYVQREGREKAPDEVVKQLESTLVTLKGIAAKDTLSADDVKEIHSATGAVLGLL